MSLTSLVMSALVVTARVDAPPMATQPAPVMTPLPPLTAGDAPPPQTPPSAWFPPASPTESSAAPPPVPAAEPPPPPVDAEVAIRAAYQNAENQQGPLDGRWRLSGADGTPLFLFVMADTGGAPSSRASSPGSPAIEGAWRDLRRAGGFAGSGLLVSVTRLADAVEIRFYETDPDAATVLTLHADASGVWSGSLMEGGVTRPVIMRRS